MQIPKMNKTTAYRVLGLVSAIILAFAVGRMQRGRSTPGQAVHDHTEESPAPAKAAVWTCSMHPQFKLPKEGKCPICFMDLIPLESGGDDAGGLRELSVSENSARLMDIETAEVERRFVTASVRMVGKIDYDETRVSYITAWVPGRLDRLFVDYTGVPVRKGDHMVSLYSPELLSAQEELLQAIAATKKLGNSDVSIVRDTTAATVVAVREKLRLWGLTPDQVRAIEEQGKADDHVTIYAPGGGIVVHKNAQEGMYVNVGTRIYTIADLSQVWVNLDAYESDLAWLRYGQQVEFTAESYPGEIFTGAISFIHPVLNQATRTVKVRVNVPNGDGRLKPGMFVRAIAQAEVATDGRVMDVALAGKWISPMHPEVVKDRPGACDVCGMPLVRAESLGYVGREPTEADKPLVIPSSAPLLTGRRAIVYVAVPGKDKPTFEGREIVLGPRAGGHYVVKHGLELGERVVTRGSFKLDAELQIQARPSMMTPDGVSATAGPELPALVESQLRELIAAAKEAIEASSPGDNLAKVRSAFRGLQESVAAVDRAPLSGDAARQWKEYAMLLGNDCAEGASVKNASDVAALRETLQGHVSGLQTSLGLAHGDHATADAPMLNADFRKQLGVLVVKYLAVQTALAGDDAAAATTAAKKGLEALGGVDMRLVTGNDHVDWMKQAGELKTLLNAVANADGIEPARAQFALLSGQIGAMLARFGVPEGRLYEAWCPMAFDNRGAAWIQDGEEISNPYFGDTMLRCGEIRKVLK